MPIRGTRRRSTSTIHASAGRPSSARAALRSPGANLSRSTPGGITLTRQGEKPYRSTSRRPKARDSTTASSARLYANRSISRFVLDRSNPSPVASPSAPHGPWKWRTQGSLRKDWRRRGSAAYRPKWTSTTCASGCRAAARAYSRSRVGSAARAFATTVTAGGASAAGPTTSASLSTPAASKAPSRSRRYRFSPPGWSGNQPMPRWRLLGTVRPLTSSPWPLRHAKQHRR